MLLDWSKTAGYILLSLLGIAGTIALAPVAAGIIVAVAVVGLALIVVACVFAVIFGFFFYFFRGIWELIPRQRRKKNLHSQRADEENGGVDAERVEPIDVDELNDKSVANEKDIRVTEGEKAAESHHESGDGDEIDEVPRP